MDQGKRNSKLTIKRETLRVLTPAELRLVAGGAPIRTRCHGGGNFCP